MYGMMKKENSENVSRRTALKTLSTSAIGMTTISGLSTAKELSEQSTPGHPLRTIKANTDSFSSLKNAQVTIYEGGFVATEASGIDKPASQNGDEHGYKVSVADLWDSRGRIAPNKASVVLESTDCSCKNMTPSEGDGSQIISGQQKADTLNSRTSTNDGVSTMENIDRSQSGWDYEGNHQGEVFVHMDNGNAGFANLAQDVTWQTSNGSVSSYDWVLCTDADENAGADCEDYDITAQGQAESNFDGDNAYSKLYADFEYCGDLGTTYDAYLRCSHDMYPDGDTVWWGRAFTRHDDGSEDPNTKFDFEYYDDGGDCAG